MMAPPAAAQDHAPRIGVLLINLGTPDAPTPAAVRRYLRQFLSDPRVVEIPQILWQPLLRGVILTTRPRTSARAYAAVWTPQGSPLSVYTAAQASALQSALGGPASEGKTMVHPQGAAPNPEGFARPNGRPSLCEESQGRGGDRPASEGKIMVRHAMRYGNPAIGAVIAEMHDTGCERIMLAPLYPQFCAATTASAIDAVGAALSAMRSQPALRILPPYYDDEAYIAALASSVHGALAALDFTPEHLLVSFHGMPQRTSELGDPYYQQCLKTTDLLRGAVNLPLSVAFQSRFGRARWLGPATDAELVALAGRGVKRLAVIAPGFASDCLETLEELALRGRRQFLGAGGEHFAALPCLNASAAGMAMLETLIRRELAGWI
ncbi:MAG: ferrochelatase [Sphingopyxis sp.]